MKQKLSVQTFVSNIDFRKSVLDLNKKPNNINQFFKIIYAVKQNKNIIETTNTNPNDKIVCSLTQGMLMQRRTKHACFLLITVIVSYEYKFCSFNCFFLV